MSVTIPTGRFQKRFPKLLLLIVALLSMSMFGQVAAAAPAQDVAVRLDRILQVQPIIVSNDDGSQTAYAFGGGPGDATYEKIVGATKKAWAQAGIHVIFLPTKSWKNTFANIGDPCQYDGHTGTGAPGDPCTGGNRPNSDSPKLIQAAETAGVASVGQHTTIIDLYFLRVEPGWPYWDSLTGAGTQLNNSMKMGVGDPGWVTEGTTEGLTIAHEIGHNLGLAHPDQDPDFPGYPNNPCPPNNLMDSGDCQGQGVPWGTDLVAEQLAKARQGTPNFAVPIPVPALPIAAKVVNNTLVAVQKMPIRKDVKEALSLILQGTKLAVNKNKPREACGAMKLFDSSVTFFLNKGQLTASQGQLLNTASKDIRVPIGCQ